MFPKTETFRKLILASRLLLGAQYFLSGLNWWVKILPFPHMNDPVESFVQPDGIGAAMIASGWMFPAAKAVELVTGLALVFNLYAPLMLVVSMPVAVITFLMDAFILDDLWRWLAGTLSTDAMIYLVGDMVFLGGTIMLPQAVLMFAYLDHYRGMFVARSMVSLPARGQGRLAGFANAAIAVLALTGIVLSVIVLVWFAQLATGDKTQLP